MTHGQPFYVSTRRRYRNGSGWCYSSFASRHSPASRWHLISACSRRRGLGAVVSSSSTHRHRPKPQPSSNPSGSRPLGSTSASAEHSTARNLKAASLRALAPQLVPTGQAAKAPCSPGGACHAKVRRSQPPASGLTTTSRAVGRMGCRRCSFLRLKVPQAALPRRRASSARALLRRAACPPDVHGGWLGLSMRTLC